MATGRINQVTSFVFRLTEPRVARLATCFPGSLVFFNFSPREEKTPIYPGVPGTNRETLSLSRVPIFGGTNPRPTIDELPAPRVSETRNFRQVNGQSHRTEGEVHPETTQPSFGMQRTLQKTSRDVRFAEPPFAPPFPNRRSRDEPRASRAQETWIFTLKETVQKHLNPVSLLPGTQSTDAKLKIHTLNNFSIFQTCLYMECFSLLCPGSNPEIFQHRPKLCSNLFI